MAKIPVIVVLPKQEPLLESATMAMEGKVRLDIPNIRYVPKGVRLLESTSAISAGRALGAEMTLESLKPSGAEVFAVRGEVEEAEIDSLDGPQDGGAQIFADPQIEPFPICPGNPPQGTADEVANFLQISRLNAAGMNGDGVAVAIMDTGFNVSFLRKTFSTVKFDVGNSWRNPEAPTLLPGNQVYGANTRLGHGSMCAWNVLKLAPMATLLDFPILAGAPQTGSKISASLMSAYAAYSLLAARWGIGFGMGQAGIQYNALVICNSWGMYDHRWDFPTGHSGRYADNPDHFFNQLVTSFSKHRADIVFAAGNCGSACPSAQCHGTEGTICGANALETVLTMAGCDTKDHWVGYSSQGPSTTGMYKDKPDMAAYTHFLGSEANGPGSADTGTSTACPVAVGCIAALRTALAPTSVPPVSLLAQLQASARKPADMNGADRDNEYGYGIIDPLSTARGLGLI